MAKTYLARPGQMLCEHLRTVSGLAGRFADIFGAGDWGRVTGLLHDLGKYSDEFQARLVGDPARVDHATAGAREAAGRYAAGGLLAYAIAGHHGRGLADGDDLKHRLAKALPAYTAFREEIVFPPEPCPSGLSCRELYTTRVAYGN